MVNARFPRRAGRRLRFRARAKKRGNPRLRNVNEALSKSPEFSENSPRIRVEYAQKLERGLQACLLLVCHAAKQEQPRGPTYGLRDRRMFFLLRMAFWLTIVLALLPAATSQPQTQAQDAPQIDAADAVIAAGAAVSDMSGFCGRQPEACKVGTQAAVIIGQRAQAGAGMVYDFIQERMARQDMPAQTGSTSEGRVVKASMNRPVPMHPGSQSTLKPADLEPAWQGSPPPRMENVPLPRPRARQPV
jgi:hypothetical protein